MVNFQQFKELAINFPEVIEQPHFEKTSFKVNKKIFATLDTSKNTATVKLTETDQSIYHQMDPKTYYAAQGAWGKQGWTYVELDSADKSLMNEILKKSYSLIAPKKLVEKIKDTIR